MLDSVFGDIRYTLRGLRRSPTFAVFAILTLALGIGANTAVFSAVHGVLLRPLPYPEPEHLAIIWSQWLDRDISRISNSGGDFRTYQREARSFAGIAALGSLIQNLTGGTRPVQVTVGWVSRNFFKTLRVEPLLGRDFQSGEPSTSLMLGYATWRQNFGADSLIIGSAVQLDGRPFTVVGVMPPGFQIHAPADIGIATDIDVWRPPDEVSDPARWVVQDVESSMLRLIGRLAPGATFADAQSEMTAIAARLREEFSDHAAVGFDLDVQPLHSEVVGHVRPALTVLQVAVALVLLIACGNVANLFLAHGLRRRDEILVRMAIGAGQRRIFRQMMTESLIIAAIGGTLGVALAWAGVQLFKSLDLANIPRIETIGIHGTALAFAVGATAVATLLFGGWPAIRAARARISEGLNLRGSGGPRLSRALIVGEVALALMLLASAGVVGRSFINLQRARPGFDPENLLTFAISLPGTRYQAPLGTANFHVELQRLLESDPGIAAAGAVWPLPLEGQLWAGSYSTVTSAGADPPPVADYRLASPGLIETLETRLIEGRNLTEADTTAALVDRALAERNWPGRSAVGQWIRLGVGDGAIQMQVVGVVENLRHRDLRTYTREAIYLPMRSWSWSDWEIFVVVRTRGDPLSAVASARAALNDLDPEIPMGKVRTMNGYMAERLTPNRLAATMLGIFSVAALILASVGLYGVLAYSISQRTFEMGIRMALGAASLNIFRLVLAQGLVMVLFGAAVGFGGALATVGALSHLVFGIAPRDPVTLIAAASLTIAIGLIACWMPAWRATRVQPASALRHE